MCGLDVDRLYTCVRQHIHRCNIYRRRCPARPTHRPIEPINPHADAAIRVEGGSRCTGWRVGRRRKGCGNEGACCCGTSGAGGPDGKQCADRNGDWQRGWVLYVARSRPWRWSRRGCCQLSGGGGRTGSRNQFPSCCALLGRRDASSSGDALLGGRSLLCDGGCPLHRSCDLGNRNYVCMRACGRATVSHCPKEHSDTRGQRNDRGSGSSHLSNLSAAHEEHVSR